MLSFISIPVLIFLPIIAAIVIMSPLFNNAIYIRRFAAGFAVLEFFYSILFYIFHSKGEPAPFNPDFQSIIPLLNNSVLNDIGIRVSFGVDSLSILMIILTTLIIMFAVISSKLYIKHHHKYFYGLILILEAVLIGIFSTTDMFVFFVLWELELIPMYLLISLWGNKKAGKSALKFVLYTFGGSLFLLLGFLLTYFTNFAMTGVMTSDLTLLNMNSANVVIQLLITACLLIGFGVKIPIVPIHGWLADTHTNSSAPVSMILAGILLKLGVYGLIRFNMGIFPLGFAVIAPILGGLALINIVYGAMLAYSQNNIKRIVAYSSISQMGIIILALASLTSAGYVASVYHIISHGVVAAGLFLIAGIIKQRFGTGNTKKLSGIACAAPRFYGFSMIILLSAAGIPFLSGFIGEFLTVYGAVNSSIPILKLFGVLSLSVLILSALYIMKFIHETFFGILPDRYKNVQDIASHEFIVLAAIAFIIVILGCFPFIIINFFNW